MHFGLRLRYTVEATSANCEDCAESVNASGLGQSGGTLVFTLQGMVRDALIGRRQSPWLSNPTQPRQDRDSDCKETRTVGIDGSLAQRLRRL
jgi:hypothetical protein